MIEYFRKVLENYGSSSKETFGNHPTAAIIRNEIPDSIRQIFTDHETQRYKIQGSPGQGQWASVPWIAIFDILVTTSAQHGYYPVFLFKQNMEGFYLSLNQGVTDIRNKFPKSAKDVLKQKSSFYKSQLSLNHFDFTFDDIILKGNINVKSELAEFYEAGNIISKYYSKGHLPDDKSFTDDITNILKLYEFITYNSELEINSSNEDNLIKDDTSQESFKGKEFLQKKVLHTRIERNQLLSKKVKQIQGYTCRACNFNFIEMYGEIGRNFIEAHHLIPLHTLKQDSVELDAENDFAVLCSNCHRMIHRLSDPSDLSQLIELITQNRGN